MELLDAFIAMLCYKGKTVYVFNFDVWYPGTVLPAAIVQSVYWNIGELVSLFDI